MSNHNAPGSSDAWVQVAENVTVFHHRFLQVEQATMRYRHADGALGDQVKRLVVQHAGAVGVLLYDRQADTVALVRQFRYPVYARMPEAERAGSGAGGAWILEIVAGIQEEGQSAEETALREVREEVGYELAGDLQPIATVFSSPGYSTEQITLFLAEIDSSTRHTPSSGLASEGEDTQLEVLPCEQALAQVADGTICDAKTVLALLHLALHRHMDAS